MICAFCETYEATDEVEIQGHLTGACNDCARLIRTQRRQQNEHCVCLSRERYCPIHHDIGTH